MDVSKILGSLLMLGLLVTAAVMFVPRVRSNPWNQPKPKPLMTDNEREFFHRLERALPKYHVFPQVAFAAFLTHDPTISSKSRLASRNRFDRKMADFVVCERGTLSIVALIELDDRSHRASNDQLRDGLTEAAGYRTIRFRSKQKPTEAQIAQMLMPEGASPAPGLSVRREEEPV